ncbi:E3 ubiquitin-protein ligase TRIM39-like [Sceloporus undulatus]|uniref:E3 ubiquitin-protein ligase TRIM39-like n=1 Tax=Sceloporus undulatus TaxID=8520 RepID=UPI001C4BF7B2|nr:E3 ubiquitin-protein ligase TRIM39-like [Sceloporus undulatus]
MSTREERRVAFNECILNWLAKTNCKKGGKGYNRLLMFKREHPQTSLPFSTGDLTLDPETAHPNLVISEDRKSVKFVEQRLRDLPDSPRRFTIYPCVLATEGFTSGRHYWEVEVGEKTHWALGVCSDSVSRKGEMTSLPETGYWRVRLFNGDKYAATTTPFTPLNITNKPKRVGVFLDYEAGKLSFYNVTDRSHIYTFTDTFTEKLWPFFLPRDPCWP